MKSQNLTVYSDFVVTQKLDEGSCSVCKKAYHKDTKQNVAIKCFNQRWTPQLVSQEVQVMRALDHPNIIKLIDHGQVTEYLPSGKSNEVNYLVMELAEKGTLFDQVVENGAFSEDVALMYFKQIVSAMAHMNSKNMCHRDLKPENILIDSDNNAKLADFGFACDLNEINYGKKMGTEGYMAPEQYEFAKSLRYDGIKSDVFSLGIILFIMVMGTPPFRKAVRHDRHYLSISMNRFDFFWKNALSVKPENYISQDLIELITMMLQHNPNERLSLNDVINTPWFNKDSSSAMI